MSDYESRSLLAQATIENKLYIVRAIVEHKDYEEVDTAIQEAIYEKNVEILTYFIDTVPQDIGKDMLDKIIMFSCKEGVLDLVEKAVRAGAKVNDIIKEESWHSQYNTPLCEAVSAGHKDIIDFLLTVDAKLKIQTYDALKLAYESGSVDIVDSLFKKVKNEEKQTEIQRALEISINEGKTELLQYLINNGADMTGYIILQRSGKTT